MSGPTPGPYYRDGCTVYALQQNRDRRPKLINRWSAHVEAALGTPRKEVEAVAVLFEFAPDLLAALKGVVRVADRATQEFDAARAAIALAEPKP